MEASFRYQTALPYEPGVTRRDPSPVIAVDGVFHAWYSKATVDPSGYFATVWHATSPDGFAWTEREEAIATGPDDAWDANGVFTPTILVAEGRYWLFYTAVPKPFDNDNGGPNCTPTGIGAAVADSPNGPWRKLDQNPLLLPSTDPEAFDSLRVDDACFVVREGTYWLYYKGRQQQHSPRETKMGLAIAVSPGGPYEKHPASPVVDGGHEVCCWPHAGGVAGLFCAVGPEGQSLRWSPDGLAFGKGLRLHATGRPRTIPGRPFPGRCRARRPLGPLPRRPDRRPPVPAPLRHGLDARALPVARFATKRRGDTLGVAPSIVCQRPVGLYFFGKTLSSRSSISRTW